MARGLAKCSSWTTVDKFQWFRLQHDAQRFLVRFGFQYDWATTEAFIQEHLVGHHIFQSFVAKNQPVVDLPDVTNE